jgi:hypothetical protein
MTKANNIILSDYISNDRFELNSYLAHLFRYFSNNAAKPSNNTKS